MLDNIYVTKLGDTWDTVAYEALGNEMYMDALIKENLEHKDIFIFPAGVVLSLPEIEEEEPDSMPPWKKRGVEGDE